jgi:hypothetical protein
MPDFYYTYKYCKIASVDVQIVMKQTLIILIILLTLYDTC